MTANGILPIEAIKILLDNLDNDEKKILSLYRENIDISFTQEDIKSKANLSTNNARVALYKLEAVLFINRNIKGRGNAYFLTENGKKIIKQSK
jgi:predicted transcriptional regulator